MNEANIFGDAHARTWICCQLGARDHYSVPRGLHRRGLLAGLITEAWVPPSSVFAKLPGDFGERLRQRYDARLSDAKIAHFSASLLRFEATACISTPRNKWDAIIARNDWFQAKAVRRLKSLWRAKHKMSRPVVFAYSYAAKEILRTARELGATSILGQIDPGPAEEKIVDEICRRNGHPITTAQRVPGSYWEAWREECDLCDCIIANSHWARKALESEGVPAQKIRVVPLAYTPPEEASTFRRAYPNSFTAARPLRVLFLGSLIPRKGIYELLEAATLLRTAPIEFRIVGPLGITPPTLGNPRVHWAGPTNRRSTHHFYREADVFILPTHSDGFALTQLEAMAWGLPVITSKNCGEVVYHNLNGLTLPTVTAEAIAEAIKWCATNPDALADMSNATTATVSNFRTENMTGQLIDCAQP